jgi:hypothetical protein
MRSSWPRGSRRGGDRLGCPHDVGRAHAGAPRVTVGVGEAEAGDEPLAGLIGLTHDRGIDRIETELGSAEQLERVRIRHRAPRQADVPIAAPASHCGPAEVQAFVSFLDDHFEVPGRVRGVARGQARGPHGRAGRRQGRPSTTGRTDRRGRSRTSHRPVTGRSAARGGRFLLRSRARCGLSQRGARYHSRVLDRRSRRRAGLRDQSPPRSVAPPTSGRLSDLLGQLRGLAREQLSELGPQSFFTDAEVAEDLRGDGVVLRAEASAGRALCSQLVESSFVRRCRGARRANRRRPSGSQRPSRPLKAQ